MSAHHCSYTAGGVKRCAPGGKPGSHGLAPPDHRSEEKHPANRTHQRRTSSLPNGGNPAGGAAGPIPTLIVPE